MRVRGTPARLGREAAALRMRVAARARRFMVPSPFEGDSRLVVLVTNHKVGTVWSSQVLRDLARHHGLRFHGSGTESVPPKWADVFRQRQGRLDHDALPPFRAVRLVRDPRDIVVSGYRYHLWTDEAWAHVPQERFGGRSYQQHLQSLPQDEGLLLEAKIVAGDTIRRMAEYRQGHPDAIDVRFEDLMADAQGTWLRILTHYRFTESVVADGLGLAEYHSARRVRQRLPPDSRRVRHVSGGGRSGEWVSLFDQRHHDAIAENAGDLLERLGYASTDDQGEG